MVHGIPTNARLWRHVTALLKDRYKTYAMDMVGYGQSSMPVDDFEHTLTNQAEAIKEVIDGLGLKGKVRVNKAGCLDACSHGPTMVIYPEDIWYSPKTKKDIEEIIMNHVKNNRIIERLIIKYNKDQ